MRQLNMMQIYSMMSFPPRIKYGINSGGNPDGRKEDTTLSQAVRKEVQGFFLPGVLGVSPSFKSTSFPLCERGTKREFGNTRGLKKSFQTT